MVVKKNNRFLRVKLFLSTVFDFIIVVYFSNWYIRRNLKETPILYKIHNISSIYIFGAKLFFFYAANAILDLLDHVDSFPR